MKATLEFNLPEEHDEHRVAVQGMDWQMILFEVDQRLRDTVKHGDSEQLADYAQTIRDYICEGMGERGLAWSR
jgi:3-methyladenine DNA glycosylase AlkC